MERLTSFGGKIVQAIPIPVGEVIRDDHLRRHIVEEKEGEMLRSYVLTPIPQMPIEVFDQALQEAVKMSRWGEMVLGEKNTELPEA